MYLVSHTGGTVSVLSPTSEEPVGIALFGAVTLEKEPNVLSNVFHNHG